MLPGVTPARAVGPPVYGTGTDGIGPRHSMPILSSQATASSTTRSAGVSTHPGMRMRLRTLGTDTVTVVTVTVVTVVPASIVTSARDTVRDSPLVAAPPGLLDTRTALAEELWADLAVAELTVVEVSAAGASAAAEVSAAPEASAVAEVSAATDSMEEAEGAVSMAAEGTAVRLLSTDVPKNSVFHEDHFAGLLAKSAVWCAGRKRRGYERTQPARSTSGRALLKCYKQ